MALAVCQEDPMTRSSMTQRLLPLVALLASTALALGAGCNSDDIPLYLQGFGDTKSLTNGISADYSVLLSSSPKDLTYVDVDPNDVGGWKDYVSFVNPTSLTFKWNPGDSASKPFKIRGIKVTAGTIAIPFVLRNTDSFQKLYIDVVGTNYGEPTHYEAGPEPDLGVPDTGATDKGAADMGAADKGAAKEAAHAKEAGGQ
jgi:hypothetical protein